MLCKTLCACSSKHFQICAICITMWHGDNIILLTDLLVGTKPLNTVGATHSL